MAGYIFIIFFFKEPVEKPAIESGESLVDELSKLHIQAGLSAALDPSDNGYFDLLPVSVTSYQQWANTINIKFKSKSGQTFKSTSALLNKIN